MRVVISVVMGGICLSLTRMRFSNGASLYRGERDGESRNDSGPALSGPRRRPTRTIWSDYADDEDDNGGDDALARIYSPCTLPVPYPRESASPTAHQMSLVYRRVCHTRDMLPFICDLHRALSDRDFELLHAQLRDNALVRENNGTFAILIVRQLAQPVSSSYVTAEYPEFECLFRLPCQQMTAKTVERFVKNFKTFVKLYTAALFSRWFNRRSGRACFRPRILVLILLDGVVSNPKKQTAVQLHTDDGQLMPYISNIQLESTNLISQGEPLHHVIIDLVTQLEIVVRDFGAVGEHNGGRPAGRRRHRHHIVPSWAWQLVTVSVCLLLVALLGEWLVVRRKLVRHRFVVGPAIDSSKSKTHIIF